MKTIPADSRYTQAFQPEPAHLASALGNHGVDVVATTSLILYFEAAANNLAAGYYEANEISVGTHVNIDHLAPARADRPVDVVATLTLQKGRRLEFSLTAHQGQVLVMRGSHHRAVMPRMDFSETDGVTGEPKTIEFWFDFHSPWCYFASHRIADIAREANATLLWKPVHLANLNAAVDGRRPLEANPNFVAWYQQDILDTAAAEGLPVVQHAKYPLGPSRALRASIYAAEQGLAEPFVTRVMTGYWSAQKDISDLDWLQSVAEQCGLDAAETRNASTADGYKNQLQQNLQQAIDRKLFGLPVAYVDSKIFWGHDHLPMLRKHLLAGTWPTLGNR